MNGLLDGWVDEWIVGRERSTKETFPPNEMTNENGGKVCDRSRPTTSALQFFVYFVYFVVPPFARREGLRPFPPYNFRGSPFY